MLRRDFLVSVSGAALAAFVPGRAVAQPLGERLSLITVARTNVLALASADGLVVVDSGDATLTEPLIASLGQVSAGARIRTLFNTHWHPEHTGANERLREAGAAIVAHENTRLWMATPTWMPVEDRYRQPRPKAAHPTETFYDSGSTTIGGERIEYGYLLEAHTSSDIYVWFRTANVLAVGDVASPARDPELDYFTGAWIGGRVDAMTRLVDLVDDRTRIVPGFGPVMTRAELRAERDIMKMIYDRTVERVRRGDDPSDLLAGGVLSGLARTWSDPKKFLYDVHKGLWAHHNPLNADVV
jgi:cyclase